MDKVQEEPFGELTFLLCGFEQNITTESKAESIEVEKSTVIQEKIFRELMHVIHPVYRYLVLVIMYRWW